MPPPSIESVLATPTSPPDSVRKPRTPRPNFNLIHRFPLPVQIQPLPPLFPHNPLSYIHVALAYIIQTLSPTQSHPKPLYRAYLSSLTQSVHVSDEETIRALWQMGFFGKGSLSRSEPEWLDQERKRRGSGKKLTSSEVTRKRREDRKEFKLERARQEREAIKLKLKEESLSAAKHEDSAEENELDAGQNGLTNGLLETPEPPTRDTPSSKSMEQEGELTANPLQKSIANGNGHIHHQPSTSESENGHPIGIRDDMSTRSSSSSKIVRFSPTVERLEFEIPTPIDTTVVLPNSVTGASVENQEHLQLTYEEAFFLAYGLGVLQVYDEDCATSLPPTALLHRFQRSCALSSPSHTPYELEPDDPFLLSYVVYHHFRSLGWVVRSGSKFSVDYLLYNRGPVFSHAEFAVLILPSYNHEQWTTTDAGRQKIAKNETKSWWWLHCVNRVQSAVQKNLVLCYVDVPPPERKESETDDMDIGKFLKRYKVREINIKRWTPNRMRD